jgi:hypothetical protein
MIRRLVKLGFMSAARCWPAAVWSYVATALVALPFALAAGVLFQKHLGDSLDAAQYARGLDPTMVLAVLLANPGAPDLLIIVLASLVILWAVASTYLTGATITAVARPQPTSTHDLYTDGGRVFGRLLRLLALALPFWALVVGLPSFGLYKGLEALTRDWISERGVFATKLLAIVICAALIFWANAACDLMRVEAVARGEHRARYAFWRGLVRAAKRPFAPLLIGAVFSGLAWVATIGHSLLDAHFARSSFFTIVVALLFQQAITFSRAFLRVAALASAVELHRPTA